MGTDTELSQRAEASQGETKDLPIAEPSHRREASRSRHVLSHVRDDTVRLCTYRMTLRSFTLRDDD